MLLSNPAFRRGVARMLIGVLVAAQLIVTAHACPSMSAGRNDGGPAQAIAAAGLAHDVVAPAASVAGRSNPSDDVASMPDCEHMKMSAQPVCAEHCHPVQQNADAAFAPSLPIVLLALRYPMPVQPDALPLRQALSDGPSSAGPAPPPHAILHCCFRI